MTCHLFVDIKRLPLTAVGFVPATVTTTHRVCDHSPFDDRDAEDSLGCTWQCPQYDEQLYIFLIIF